MKFMLFIEIIIGIILAAAVVFAFRKMKDERFAKFFAGSLIIAALIYVGFATFGVFIGEATANWILIEIGGFFLYSVFAYLGIKLSEWFLAIGWATHVLWDVGLHFGEATASFVPDFYPPVCIGFDLAIAVYIVYRFYFRN